MLAISTQDVKSHEGFARELKLNFPVLADSHRQVSKAYGVLMTPVGLAGRVTFIIGPDGRITHVDEHVNFRTAGKDVLRMLKEDKAAHAAAPAPAATAAIHYPGWQTDAPIKTFPDGLEYQDLDPGAGESPKNGQTVTVNYTGYLTNGQKFDSSFDRNQPFSFVIGQGQVIRGWDEGLSTMRPGGRRKLIVPPSLGYGPNGAGGVIPPNATLVFDAELLSAGR